MAKTSKRKIIVWAIAALFIISASYAYSARFTGFIGAPRQEKIVYLGSSLVIIGILTSLAIRKLSPALLRSATRERVILFACLGTAFAAAIILLLSTPPPFPENHTLEISAQVNKSSLSHTNAARLISIDRVYLPGNKRVRVEPSELFIEGESIIQADNSILLDTGQLGILKYRGFMQAGIELVFQTGAREGIAHISWDGVEQIIDLGLLKPPTYTMRLMPAFKLDQADKTRKLFVGSAMLAEFLSLAILITIISLSLSIFLRERVVVNYSGVLVRSTLALVVLIGIVEIFSRPVQFQDPNLEAVIRDALHNPDQPIYRHQLLTIVTLNASNQAITNLNGIEYLRNLSELNLRENMIVDLSPLSKLKHIKKLDLRKNFVNNLEPISGNTSLEYLNLHSNPRITSIAPLESLINLETLILRDVPVGDEISTLEHFPGLEHLNLRNTAVSDLTPLGTLANLEYLNLHSNPDIETISPLAGTPGLETLILGDVPLENETSSLKQFTNLEHLNLRNTGITDLSPLTGLTRLIYLNLHSNSGIESISPLASLNNLETLILENVPVGDQIGVLINFPKLVQLNLSNTGITNTESIGSLISDGAFRDDTLRDLKSSIDIHDNPLDSSINDSFASLRPYWDNISLRAPYILPAYSPLEAPSFSHPAGFYTNGFMLEISSDEPSSSIHYTLDGSAPTRDSPLYTAPILITNRDGQPNILSEIQDISPYWKSPSGEVFKATVVRASVFSSEKERSSPATTQTYFVDDDIYTDYSLPTISLATDADFLFDYQAGIYTQGRIFEEYYDPTLRNLGHYNANYHQQGVEWERPVHIEMFEAGGQPAFSKDGAVRIHGHATRFFPEKSLRLYAHSDVDNKDEFNYEFFPDFNNKVDNSPIKQFNNILLHNSGNDWDQTMFRDALMQSLVEHTDLDTMAYRPVNVFINGEYWGIHNLRPRLDEYYLAAAYQVDPEEVVILDEDLMVYKGEPGDEKDFKDFLEFIEQNTLQDNHNYEVVQSRMDVDNFIDYQVSEIYSSNIDWPHNNVRYWRLKTGENDPTAAPGKDGRWRWMLVDTDQGFGIYNMYGIYQHQTLEEALKPEKKGFLLSSLLQNESFKIQFINRFADHLNTSFQEVRVIDRIDQMQAVLEPEMAEHIRRWRVMEDSFDTWNQNVDVLREFARNRPETVRKQIVEHFGLEGTATLSLKTDGEQGYIQVNSIPILSDTPGVVDPEDWSGVYFKGIPIQITANPNPGYQFTGWQGLERDGDQGAITLDLTGDLTLQANFAPLP